MFGLNGADGLELLELSVSSYGDVSLRAGRNPAYSGAQSAVWASDAVPRGEWFPVLVSRAAGLGAVFTLEIDADSYVQTGAVNEWPGDGAVLHVGGMATQYWVEGSLVGSIKNVVLTMGAPG